MIAASTLMLAGCDELQLAGDPVQDALDAVTASDEAGLNEIMMTVADPEEAIAYFRRMSANEPENLDHKRALAASLIRGDRASEAVTVLSKIVNSDAGTDADRVNLVDALVRAGQWDAAHEVMQQVSDAHQTYQRYKLEAMIADARENWEEADSFYETAAGLTMQPAAILNNWGYSNLIRGNFADAEVLFQEAIRQNGRLLTAKNNLILARSAQRKYDLPVMPMSQTERAELIYTLALTAIKNGDVQIGKGLLREAVDSHPQYFEAAARSLAALEGSN
jgi:Flp pilus assembly protein TadD